MSTVISNARLRVQAEIDRLQRNMDRREARERAKGILPSPSAAPSPGAEGTEAGDNATPAPGKKGRGKKNTEGTARKCANCGQVGHIKTNKKSAPAFSICFSCIQAQDEAGIGKESGISQPMKRQRGTDSDISDVSDMSGLQQQQEQQLTTPSKRKRAAKPVTSDWLFQPATF